MIFSRGIFVKMFFSTFIAAAISLILGAPSILVIKALGIAIAVILLVVVWESGL